MKCPMCGNCEFESGIIQGRMNLKFKSNDSNALTKLTVFGGNETTAQRCKECGFIAIFAK